MVRVFNLFVQQHCNKSYKWFTVRRTKIIMEDLKQSDICGAHSVMPQIDECMTQSHIQ